MSLTYTTWVDQLANIMVVASSDANFQTFLPGCIDYAEQRIYRELDPLDNQVNTIGTLSSGVRTLTLSGAAGQLLVLDQLAVLTPVGSSGATGTRNPIVPTTRAFIDSVYPSNSQVTGVPAFYCRNGETTITVGPAPDRAYSYEVIGTVRPTPLSSTNTTTALTDFWPDLFMAASLVFAYGYQRDFGGQTDNPQAAQSWENQYKTLFQSANVEEARRRFRAEGWTSQQPSPVATPPRV